MKSGFLLPWTINPEGITKTYMMQHQFGFNTIMMCQSNKRSNPLKYFDSLDPTPLTVLLILTQIVDLRKGTRYGKAPTTSVILPAMILLILIYEWLNIDDYSKHLMIEISFKHTPIPLCTQ